MAQPVTPGSARAGRVLCFTGNGKGKTTAALGIMMRAAGHGLSCAMFSFIKSGERECGEHIAARHLPGVSITCGGSGFVRHPANNDGARTAANECWEACREKLRDRSCRVVILDEITYAVNYGWLEAAEVAAAIRERPAEQHVVLTGRDAPPALLQLADTVTEMTEIRHAYHAGVPAAEGIES